MRPVAGGRILHGTVEAVAPYGQPPGSNRSASSLSTADRCCSRTAAVCSDRVVARRLAENPDVGVRLLEAGGDDDVPGVTQADQWPINIGSERDWYFHGQPNPHVNGRSIPFSMGKILGGGSSINIMVWARGHQRDWDFFASETCDPAWSYDSALEIYRRIED